MSQLYLPPTDQSFSIGYAHNGTVRNEFLQTIIESLSTHAQTLRNIISQSGPYIYKNRNRIVKHFLSTNSGSWLWMLDNDIYAPSNTIDLLLSHADPSTTPILGALYFNHAANDPIPTRVWPVYRNDFTLPSGVEINKIIPMQCIAMGCTLIHKSVLTAMDTGGPEPWFGHDEVKLPDGQLYEMGEDYTFCTRAASYGFPIHAYTIPTLTHHKTCSISYQTFVDQCRLETLPSSSSLPLSIYSNSLED